MSEQFSFRIWRERFGWQGLKVAMTRPVSGYQEVKPEAWMQAADAFVPGGLLLADVPLGKSKARVLARTRINRRRSF